MGGGATGRKKGFQPPPNSQQRCHLIPTWNSLPRFPWDKAASLSWTSDGGADTCRMTPSPLHGIGRRRRRGRKRRTPAQTWEWRSQAGGGKTRADKARVFVVPLPYKHSLISRAAPGFYTGGQEACAGRTPVAIEARRELAKNKLSRHLYLLGGSHLIPFESSYTLNYIGYIFLSALS